MAKKGLTIKKVQGWHKKKIDKKFYFGSILFILLLCISVAFVYSKPAVGIPIQDHVQTYFQDLFLNWTNPPVIVTQHKPTIPTSTFAIPTSTFIATTTTNCQSVEYTSSQAAAFITAYENNGNGSLHLIVVCGTPSQGGYATQFTLTTNNGVISSSQFSYHDAQQPGPTTKYTCRLSVTGSHLAVLICGESSFTLAY
jgi:hypothetical protein